MKLGCMLITHNNGTGSRVSDCSRWPDIRKPEPDNFLTLCLDSYFASVTGDCPFVVIDDGSTDDSVEIISRYENRITRFIRKDSNTGLSPCMEEAASILIDELGCDIICRFDGDIEFITKGWDRRFVRHFETERRAGAAGACQILPFGALWSLGDMLVHPEGYTHVFGVREFLKPLEQLSTAPVMVSSYLPLGNVECDSVMGCLAAFRSSAYKRINGLRDEFIGFRGQTEDLNLRLLLEGFRVTALGGIIFIHRHMEHAAKSAVSDESGRMNESIELWKRLWGWDKVKPDLKAVWEGWKDTPLTRNLIQNPDGSIEYTGPY